jgi:hypothetical protein
MIHKSQINKKTETIAYWRNPTKEEIKFGHGALHYRDFDFNNCFDADGFLKLKVRATNDYLIYYYAGIEYSIAKNAALNMI